MRNDGCVYCRQEKNGDFPDNHESLIDYEDDIELVSDNKNLYLKLTKKVWRCVWIEDYELHESLDFLNDNRSCIAYYHNKIKINYCPMCGRNISEKPIWEG